MLFLITTLVFGEKTGVGDLIENRAELSASTSPSPYEARSLFCYWCVRELGENMTSMAKVLGLTQPAIGYAVDRGERLAKKENMTCLINFLVSYGRPSRTSLTH